MRTSHPPSIRRAVIIICVCAGLGVGFYYLRPSTTDYIQTTPRAGAPLASAVLDTVTEDQAPPVNSESESFRQALDALPPIRRGEIGNPQAVELLRLWAAIDPKAAIEYAAARIGLHGRLELAAELLGAWLAKGGDAPKAWVLGLPTGNLRSQLLPTIISGLAATQPREALRLADTLQRSHRQSALSSLFAEWGGADPKVAAAEAAKLPDAQDRMTALVRVAKSWAQRDLNAAVTWVLGLAPDPELLKLDYPVSVMETLVEEWASQAPQDALTYLAAGPDTPERIKLLALAASQWSDQNFEAALKWAANLTNEKDRNLILGGVLSKVGENDMRDAATLALALPPTARQQPLGFIINQWLANDPPSLTRWASAHTENPAAAADMKTIVTAWADINPDSAGRWLDTLPAGASRDAACATLTEHLAPTRPDLARKWAATIANPELRLKHEAAIPPQTNTTP